jgi:hypothetical protein
MNLTPYAKPKHIITTSKNAKTRWVVKPHLLLASLQLQMHERVVNCKMKTKHHNNEIYLRKKAHKKKLGQIEAWKQKEKKLML